MTAVNLIKIDNKKKTIVSPGYQKAVPKLGMKRDGHEGNLIIEFIVDFPKSLTTEQIETLKTIL